MLARARIGTRDGSAEVTWLGGLPAGDGDWDRLAALCPDAMDALAALVAAAWEETDPVLLELARLRIATLLGHSAELGRRSGRAHEAGLTDEQVAALPSWPTSPLFTSRERACLAFTEQFVVDANGVTDADVAAVTGHLGAAGCYDFVQAVSALEGFQRACLTLGISDPPGVDEILARARERASTSEVPQ